MDRSQLQAETVIALPRWTPVVTAEWGTALCRGRLTYYWRHSIEAMTISAVRSAWASTKS